jgi:nucleotide-binding universal stress UspA family protein
VAIGCSQLLAVRKDADVTDSTASNDPANFPAKLPADVPADDPEFTSGDGPPAEPVARDPLTRVAVGVDGSASSLAALEWASRAVVAGGQVHVVVAVATTLGLSAVEPGTPTTTTELEQQLAGPWGEAARTEGVELRGHVVDDSAADALIQVAIDHRCDAIVVNAQGGAQRALRLIGRTISKLLRRSPVALIIVPEQLAGSGDRDTIVVGVGQSQASTAAMRWAANYANARHVRVAVVKAVSARPTLSSEGLFVLLAHFLDPSVLHRWAQDDADQFAEELQRLTHAETDITTTIVDGSAGARLVEAGQHAALLVIGRGKPAAVHHAISHAPCPVVVISGDEAGDGEDREEDDENDDVTA